MAPLLLIAYGIDSRGQDKKPEWACLAGTYSEFILGQNAGLDFQSLYFCAC